MHSTEHPKMEGKNGNMIIGTEEGLYLFDRKNNKTLALPHAEVLKGKHLYISMYVMVYCLCIDVVYGLLQFGIILVYPIMSLYDGTRGKSIFMKWFFYWFYVGHLVLCGLIRVMM